MDDLADLGKEDLERSLLREEIRNKRLENEKLERPWWRRPAANLAGLIGGIVMPIVIGAWSIRTGAWNVHVQGQLNQLQAEKTAIANQLLDLEQRDLREGVEKLQEKKAALESDIESLHDLRTLAKFDLHTVQSEEGGLSIEGQIGRPINPDQTAAPLDELTSAVDRLAPNRIQLGRVGDKFFESLCAQERRPESLSTIVVTMSLDRNREVPVLTDAGLAAIVQLPGLRHISISSLSLTNKGIAHLLKAQKLETIVLIAGDGLTAQGVRSLAGIDSLRRVVIRNGNDEVDAAVRGLQEELDKR